MKSNPTVKNTIALVSARMRFALLGGALALALGNLVFSQSSQAKDAKISAAQLTVNDEPLARDGRLNLSFAPVVKKVSPSVVNVFTSTKPRPLPRGYMLPEEFFRRFFGRDEFDNGNRGRAPSTPRQHGLGSGVIVTKDGYILTNNHVVENADDVKVALNDGREFTAKIVGKDPRTDIAVLKVEAESLPYLTLADSDKLEIGDVVLAIGNPFNVGQTVTMGIVSAKGRSLMERGYEDFIQTDAAINPGNSGGALVDSEGRLVGINSAILSRTGGNLGIGFAVPVNIARFVLESITKEGRVVRGYLGVGPQDLTPSLAKQFKAPLTRGVLLVEITPKSPADKAGLKSGDIVVEFNGKPVEDARSFRLQVAQTAPGTKVPVKIIREGEKENFTATLGTFQDAGSVVQNEESSEPWKDPLDGVTVDDLSNQYRAQLGLPRNVRGTIVARIDPDSPSYEAGLREGDVIQEINRQPVGSAEEAVELSNKIKDDTVLLKVWSRGTSKYVVVDQAR